MITKKTKYMNFSLRVPYVSPTKILFHTKACLKNNNFVLKIENCPEIQQATEMSYLGIQLDDMLTWERHVEGYLEAFLLLFVLLSFV